MPDFESLFPGRFLKKTDLARPTTIRIVDVFAADIAAEEEGDDGKKEKAKGIIKFKAKPGELGSYAGDEWVLCKTNATLISVALGGERDFVAWKGRLVTIHHDPEIMFGREKRGGIRVYGGPELTREMKVEIKMPRKKRPEVYRLQPTGKKPATEQPTAPPPPQDESPEPGSDG